MSDRILVITRNGTERVLRVEPTGINGAAGPNSVTSATTSDGTATLTFASVGSPIVKASTSAGVSARTNSGTECFSWGAGNGQNFTLTAGTGVAFNATTYTFGTGAASAMKTALAITSADITFNSAITVSGAIATTEENANIYTTGNGAPIYTTGSDAAIFTSGENAAIATSGLNAYIYTSGNNATISTDGTSAHIFTDGGGYVQTSSTFKITNGTNTTTLSGTQTADRAIAFPDASGTVALTSSNVATATALANARTIFGQSFNGTANIGGGTITLANNLTTSGNFALTFTSTAATNVTLPTTGTLATLAGTETLTNKTLTTPTIAQINTPAATNFTIAPGTTGFVDISKTSAASTRESILRAKVSDSGDDAFHIFNSTTIDGSFAPGFSMSRFSSAAFCGGFVAQTTAANDTGTGAMMVFTGRRTSSTTDPNNGTLSDITTRPLFAWENNGTRLMTVSAAGGLSIGTTTDAGATNLLVAGTITTSSSLNLPKTITAAGTTGARTINQPSGSVNFAAAATSLVVTNSLCTVNSVIVGMIATNDATANGLRIVAGAGSFTIHMLVAPTAETRVNFLLTN